MTGSNEHDRRIAAMFDRIAHRYDLLNRVLSFGLDMSWRRRAVAIATLGPGERALDVGAGTGDLSFALAAAGPSGRVVALDLAVKMLVRARARARSPIGLVAGSAEALPFSDGVFSCVTAGFAVRNFADLARGLSEMRRTPRCAPCTFSISAGSRLSSPPRLGRASTRIATFPCRSKRFPIPIRSRRRCVMRDSPTFATSD